MPTLKRRSNGFRNRKRSAIVAKLKRARREKARGRGGGGESYAPVSDNVSEYLRSQPQDIKVPNFDNLKSFENNTFAQQVDQKNKSWWKSLSTETKIGIGAVIGAGLAKGLQKRYNLGDFKAVTKFVSQLSPQNISDVVEDTLSPPDKGMIAWIKRNILRKKGPKDKFFDAGKAAVKSIEEKLERIEPDLKYMKRGFWKRLGKLVE